MVALMCGGDVLAEIEGCADEIFGGCGFFDERGLAFDGV